MITITDNLHQEMERAAQELVTNNGALTKQLTTPYDHFFVSLGSETSKMGIFLTLFEVDGQVYTLYQQR